MTAPTFTCDSCAIRWVESDGATCPGCRRKSLPALAVRVIQGAPCLVHLWVEPPAHHLVYAREHRLVSRVWEASEGKRWEVVAFHAWERSTFVAGARLSLDEEGYRPTREGEAFLERVRDDVLAGGW